MRFGVSQCSIEMIGVSSSCVRLNGGSMETTKCSNVVCMGWNEGSPLFVGAPLRTVSAKVANYAASLFGQQPTTGRISALASITMATSVPVSIWPSGPGGPSRLRLYIKTPSCSVLTRRSPTVENASKDDNKCCSREHDQPYGVFLDLSAYKSGWASEVAWL